ncbi:A/G-specific adenine glycosylase [Pedobacter sp.]|nr:A/G-specific adenine glycosylase [Candidatus Saccharibacteria bacterium]
MQLTPSEIADFQATVWDYFQHHARAMPWRDTPSPYFVMVSELMLQQTQVSRVIPKFEAFIAAFPDIQSLAQASLADVLQQWSGLGYNRRAQFLHRAAQQVVAGGGGMPTALTGLVALPGIGPNTAGAIMNYAYDQPTVFIETNIRTVYLHHFFADHDATVNDATLKDLVEQTQDGEQPRQWYWALMDYGAYLKKTAGGRLDQSSHYKKQSPLSGSPREMRGRIIKQLTVAAQDESMLRQAVDADKRFLPALQALQSEGLIEQRNSQWCLTGYKQAS